MAIFKPIHVVESQLGSINKVAGQLIITTDVGNIYFDASTSNRILIANKYILPVATENALGGIKKGAALDVDEYGNVTITSDGHTHTIAQISGLKVTAGQINELEGIQDNVQKQLNTRVKETFVLNGYTFKDKEEINLTPSDINAVPLTREINGKALSSDITLTAANVNAIASDQRGAANGVASLVEGKIPVDQIPTMFDDVVFGYYSNGKFYKESSHVTQISGENGKIYVDLTNNNLYIYKNSAFVESASTLQLGTTSETAFRGDYGNILYNKLMVSKGSTTKGIYLDNGTPTEMTYSIEKDVPPNAVFTDTHYASGTVVNNSTTATTNTTTALANGNIFINHIEDGVVKNSHKISGSGATTVTSDANGNLLINSTDTNTTYNNVTQTASGLMTASDKIKLDGIAREANNYTLPVAKATVLGGVKSGAYITVDDEGNVRVVDNSHKHDIENITGLQSALKDKLDVSSAGKKNGVAQLDGYGHVPISQLPSYVDDILEFNTKSDFPKPGESGKIYVNLADNLTYRWSGTEYVEISPSIGLGRTSSTAFPGDAGEALEKKINIIKGSKEKPIYLNNGAFIECGDSLDVNIDGNAKTTTATDTNSTVEKSYFISFVNGDGPQEIKINDGLKVNTLQGTKTGLGKEILQIGNETASGTDGNKHGQLKIYGQKAGYALLSAANIDNGVALTLPNEEGILARIEDNVASATKLKPGKKINGTLFDGTDNITTEIWGAKRTIILTDYDGSNSEPTENVDGHADFTLKLPATIKATLEGNADTATEATMATQLKSNAGSSTLPVFFTGGKPTAITNLELTNNSRIVSSNDYTLANYVKGTVGVSDYWRVGGGATETNAGYFDIATGYLEIATAQNGNEPIYVRQYNSNFTKTALRTLTLLDSSGNTSIPGAIDVTGSITGNAGIISEGALTANTRLDVKEEATIGGTLGVEGATALSSTLNVSGATALTDTLTVSGTVVGNSTITADSGFITSASDGLKMTYGPNCGVIFQNSDNDFNIIPTVSGSNGNGVANKLLKPLTIALKSGKVSLGHTLEVTGVSTFNDKTIHSGRVTIPTVEGTINSGKTLSNSAIHISTRQQASKYHPVIGVQGSSGNYVNIGGDGDNFGFYGYLGSTTNDSAWKFVANITSGNWFTDKGISAFGGFIGDLTGTASSAEKLTSSAGSTTTPIYFNDGKPVALSETIGNNRLPVYLNKGIITACDGFYITAGLKDGTILGERATAEGNNTTASGFYSHAEGYNTTASGDYSHAEGRYTTASYLASHVEGTYTTASMFFAHAEGSNTIASGESSHAEGTVTTASGSSSHAEGYYATASDNYSHAEGRNTTASGESSHAEGGATTASGLSSHAEGTATRASGNYSHAGGYFTKATYDYQTVIGTYNDNKSSNLFEIGNGEVVDHSVTTSNAFSVSRTGDAYVQNSIQIGNLAWVKESDGSYSLKTV